MLRPALTLLVLLALPAAAQDPCFTQCNRQASECLKACVGDPRDVKAPGHADRMMKCLSNCRRDGEPCRHQCQQHLPTPAPVTPPAAEPPPAAPRGTP